ncbi:MAG: 50S ribosomal protein L25/general stress protein Ctc [Phenylobacterium sp.]|uniref:50S ribosomal protein L25/general stress protein Ctc n=1 Tax=Phenylobacterium sp. TaxID=1871053 RepID=UPI001A5E3731|nr:50S ribosomal protein L25/general stress protein Ctc [Phenylobacterium sp.]MBL8773170.1 50S ribosomal protein L25/general stress protein Ctc [Phenylobacterium sp.]
MAEIVLNVEVREQTGTGSARATRRDGKVPGVLYGGGKDPVAISVRSNEFRKALYTGKLLGHLVTLKYGQETQPVIAKAVDMHPVTDEPWHFDLYRVDAHQEIKIEVPVHFANQDDSPGLKRGGSLNIALHTVTVSCHADEIPEEIVVDLTGKEIGDSIRVSDLKLPGKGVVALDGDATVASIAAAKVDTGGAEGEAAEGEAEA